MPKAVEEAYSMVQMVVEGVGEMAEADIGVVADMPNAVAEIAVEDSWAERGRWVQGEEPRQSIRRVSNCRRDAELASVGHPRLGGPNMAVAVGGAFQQVILEPPYSYLAAYIGSDLGHKASYDHRLAGVEGGKSRHRGAVDLVSALMESEIEEVVSPQDKEAVTVEAADYIDKVEYHLAPQHLDSISRGIDSHSPNPYQAAEYRTFGVGMPVGEDTHMSAADAPIVEPNEPWSFRGALHNLSEL